MSKRNTLCVSFIICSKLLELTNVLKKDAEKKVDYQTEQPLEISYQNSKQ